MATLQSSQKGFSSISSKIASCLLNVNKRWATSDLNHKKVPVVADRGAPIAQFGERRTLDCKFDPHPGCDVVSLSKKDTSSPLLSTG